MAEFLLEKISRTHDRQSFDSGVIPLNHFLKTQARQQTARGTSRTICAIDPVDCKTILGYYSLMPEHVLLNSGSKAYKKLGPHLTGILLARLATDLRYRGQGIGRHLLINAIDRACKAIELSGGMGIVLDAKDGAIEFYRQYDFHVIDEKSSMMFLPVSKALEILREFGLR